MEIALIPPLAKFVEDQLKAGRYASANDLVNAAVSILQGHEQEFERMTPEEVEELRKEIAIGIEELDRGEGEAWDADEIKAQGRRILEARQRKSASGKKAGERKRAS